jgi:hypothetical protein
MYSITLKSIPNKVQPIKGFVYERVSYSTVVSDTIEVVVVPRTGSPPRCSGCGRPGPTYDHAPQPRVWVLPPLFKFALAVVYTMRRVKCPTCGVLVEKVPWATGKHRLCDGFRLLLARWARHLSWDETADAFKVAWADVYASVQCLRFFFQGAHGLSWLKVLGLLVWGLGAFALARRCGYGLWASWPVALAGLLAVQYLDVTTPWVRQHDVGGHREYVEHLRAHRALPAVLRGWETWQPPLYYCIAAAWPRARSSRLAPGCGPSGSHASF